MCAKTRALKFRVLHIAVVEPPETSRSSGRMNLTHLTSTSRQDVLKCAGIVSVFVPRWYSLPCWSTSLSAMASATRLRGQTFFQVDGELYARDHEIRVDGLGNLDVCRAGLQDVLREVLEQVFEIRVVGRDRHVRFARVGRPLVEHGGVDAVRADQADAVDDDAVRVGGRCDRVGVRARGGFPIREHDHDLGVRRVRVEQRVCLRKSVRVVCKAACRKASTAAFSSSTEVMSWVS